MRFIPLASFIMLCFLTSLLGSWALASPATADGLRAGAAKVDITPDVQAMKVPLGGYAARRAAPATGVHDPIFARALVLSEGAAKAGVVSVDLCFLPASLTAEVVRRIRAAGVTGLDADHLLLAATHSHTAPDPLAMHRGNTFTYNGWTRFDAALLAFTADRIAQAIVQADKRQVPARAGWGTQETRGLNRNRRDEPVVDPALTALKVADTAGRPLAALVNFAAHPTLYSDKMLAVSADWPGVMTADIEKAMGHGAVCLFLNGAEGDAAPKEAEGMTADARVQDYGHRVSQAALALLNTISPRSELSLAAWTHAIFLPPRKANGMFLLSAATYGAGIPQARQLVDGLMPQTTMFHFVRLGNLLLIGFPCEPSGELGLAAKAEARKAGFALPAVVALANDWLAYALTPAQYRAGKYEAMMSFYGDQLGPTLLAALQAGLHRHTVGR